MNADATSSTLLAAGADPSVTDKDGYTALVSAANNGHDKVTEILLAAGADPSIRDKDGYTPLDHARRRNNFKIAQLLEFVKGWHPIEIAAKFGYSDFVQMHLKRIKVIDGMLIVS